MAVVVTQSRAGSMQAIPKNCAVHYPY